MQRLPSRFAWLKDENVRGGGPFYLFMLGVLAVAYVAILVSDEAMRQPRTLVLFTALVVVHGALHLTSAILMRYRRWIPAYCLVQGLLVFAIGQLTGSSALILGLYMAMIGQCVGLLWPQRKAAVAAASFFVILLAANTAILWGSQALLDIAPMAAGLVAFVLLYVVLYVRQVRAREEAQALLLELENAHHQLQSYAERIEELTIDQERQRMARELHDTLVQGVAGLILKLEAADSHLEGGNTQRGQALVQQAVQRARETLHDARRAIQALRPVALEQGTLIEAVGDEVDRFAAASGIHIAYTVDGQPPSLSPEVAQDLLRIVQESLRNVQRHAHASKVRIRLAGDAGRFSVTVQDNGVGFDPAEVHGRPGFHGLVGMQERAERAGGRLSVDSAPGRGTTVVLQLEEAGA